LQTTHNRVHLGTRRIFNFDRFWDQLGKILDHGAKFGCNFVNLIPYKDVRFGLSSTIHVHCNMCNMNFKVTTCDKNINDDVVEGIQTIGIGYSNINELFVTMNIPFMSQRYFFKTQREVGNMWEQLAAQSMKDAAKEEENFAIANGNVDKDGVPLIAVVADGCWSKRSYRTKYDASSGMAAIIGHKFGKVLFFGVKNKYCSVCAIGMKTTNHICAKNYDGSSTSMESSIIVEGFCKSENMYGIRYNKLIADGDSSTYNKILQSRPYSTLTVEKVECRNHLLRNFCNKIKALSQESRMPIGGRKLLYNKILRFRTGVQKAIQFRKTNPNKMEGQLLLAKDIQNSIKHIFGHHSDCDSYFCGKNGSSEEYEQLTTNYKELHLRLLVIVANLASNARSLIENVDSNIVENFNSIVAKFVGGKRVNFAAGKTYQTRCAAAVTSHNTKKCHSSFKKIRYGTVPRLVKRFELSTNKKRERRRQKPKRRTIRKPTPHGQDLDYGENAVKPDITKEEFDIKAKNFLKNLDRTPEELIQIQEGTVLQADSGAWMEIRRQLVTASNFHSICTRRRSTNTAPLVKRLLYSGDIKSKAIAHGKNYESVALRQLETQEGIQIKNCGLFIHPIFKYLGKSFILTVQFSMMNHIFK